MKNNRVYLILAGLDMLACMWFMVMLIIQTGNFLKGLYCVAVVGTLLCSITLFNTYKKQKKQDDTGKEKQ